jgi:hypothetical protein
VSLRIAGSEVSHLAHTLDVSNRGVKLGGCRGEMKVGDKIEIRYRTSWHNSESLGSFLTEGSVERQIGAECLEPEKQVWGAPLPRQADEHEEKSARD